MDEPEMTVCDECDFQFQVIFNNDAENMQRVKDDEPSIEFCPRCGWELGEQPIRLEQP